MQTMHRTRVEIWSVQRRHEGSTTFRTSDRTKWRKTGQCPWL